MDRTTLKIAVENSLIEWQRHALERMMERGISREIVKGVLLTGEVIEDYPDDKPYPSALFLGWHEDEPFHVVSALDSENGCCFIITSYKPDLEHFESDYKTRRKDDNKISS
ncbi:MAG: DUF4258 domain-containing protein [Nitrospirae bacterium]|nr:DUF4258 domain-containing protein [Nitrospirota bacterium]